MIGANAEVGVAVANFFPRIGLSALYGGQSPNIGDVVDENFSIWNIAGEIAGPIFQGGRIIETYYAQQAFWDCGSIAQYKQTIVTAFQEVSDALIAQNTLVAQRALLWNTAAGLARIGRVIACSATQGVERAISRCWKPSSCSSPRKTRSPRRNATSSWPWLIFTKPWAVDGI